MKFVFHIQKKQSGCIPDLHGNRLCTPVVTDDFNPERDKFLKMRREIVKQCDVLVDGRYEEDKRDVTYHWAGSTNRESD